MGKTAILAVRIIGDATDAIAAMDRLDGSMKGMQGTMDKASAGAGIALGAITAMGVAAGNAASEAQQASGAVESVFGSIAGKITAQAEEASQAVGLSETSYSNLASVLGAQLKNMGISLEEAGDKTDWLIGLGADLSATFGGTTSEAVSALSSLLRGERDPIERYGVSMNQAAIDAEKAALGLSGLTGEADKNATLQATLSLLTRQTADAQGQFAREADTAAGQAQRSAAEWENASAALGEQLLPLMSDGAKIAADLAKWMGDNVPIVTAVAIAVGGLSGAILVINGAMKVFAAVQAIQTAAQWANNAAWLASPVTWIVLAIVAAVALLVAAGIYLVQNWDQVAATAEVVWNGVISWIQDVGKWFEDVIGSITKWWDDLMKTISDGLPDWARDMLGGGSSRVRVESASTSSIVASGLSAFSTLSAPTAIATASPTVPLTATGYAAPASAGNTYNSYSVDARGSIDPDGTARAVRATLRDHESRTGRGGESKWRR